MLPPAANAFYKNAMRMHAVTFAALFALSACGSRDEAEDAPSAADVAAPAPRETGTVIPSAPVGADGKYHSGVADMDVASRGALDAAIAAIPANMRIPAENVLLCRESRAGVAIPPSERAAAMTRAYEDLRAEPSLATRCDAASVSSDADVAPAPIADQAYEPAPPSIDPAYQPSTDAVARTR